MRAFIARLLLLLCVIGALAVSLHTGWQGVLDRYAGAWTHDPEDASWLLSDRARTLVEAAFAPADEAAVVDGRIRGYADVAPASDSAGVNPLAWLKRRVRAHAAGVVHPERGEAEYMARLVRQIQATPGAYRARLFARDAAHDPDPAALSAPAAEDAANEAVVAAAARAPDRLTPVVSMHPYRADAVAAIQRWAKAGVTGLSWSPVAQGIDLDDPRAVDCYRAMAEHGMTLYLPVGARHADNGDQGWIDPNDLRAPLAAGVSVVVTLGGAFAEDGRALMPRLFALLGEARWQDRLSVDLAGVLAPDQLEDVLLPLLQHPQFFGRLRYASGYPAPAVASAIRLSALVRGGFLDAALVDPLREIYDVNPLLFAFVTMRQIHLPATELGFDPGVFFADKAS